MELPKNIVQIGTPDKHYKIFVEDYVISYIKQVNRYLNGGQTGVALYGKKYEEGEVYYYFLYGAAEIPGIENRGQYLSELEKEQIAAKKQEFFEEWEFLAWCTLWGELPDGFWLLEQGKGIMINGYATFFEKNDHMLNFMVIIGNRENRAERENTKNVEISSGTPRANGADYEWGRLAEGGNIDHRLSERSRKLEDIKRNSGNYRSAIAKRPAADKYEKNGGWKTLLTGVAVMLCVLGIATFSDEEKMQNLQVAARHLLENLNEQKLPDAGEGVPNVSRSEKEDASQIGALADMETETAQDENNLQEMQPETQTEQQSEQQPELQGTAGQPGDTSTGADKTDGSTPENQPQISETSKETPDIVPQEQPENPPAEVMQPEVTPQVQTVTYVVEKGDMLLKICKKRYGSDARIQEICELNGIDDPDDIKVGQIILLPE